MLLIDGMMLVRRCHAKMDFLKNSKGQSTGLEYGFLRSIQSLQKKMPTHTVVICFDPKTSPKRNPNEGCYKANRTPMPAEFYERVDVFKRFLKSFYPIVEHPDNEADDLLAVLSRDYDGPHYIYTNDDDLLQCIDEQRQVFVLKSFGSKLFEWNTMKVLKKYGVLPKDLPLFRTFVGDKSDNLFGVPRIPRKYLAKLICWKTQCNMNLNKFIKELKTADWSDKMRAAIVHFIDEGNFWYNYELMHLTVPDWNGPDDFPVPWPIPEPELDKDFVLSKLQEWEIRTLKICEPFLKDIAVTLKGEEF